MKVQRIRIPDSAEISWLVLGDDFLPVQPIQRFLQYLENLEKSPNTLRAYAYHLKLYWEYLTSAHLDWTAVRLSELAGFVAWLREPQPGVLLLEQCEAKRSESTINAILSAVASLYEFHQRDGAVGAIPLYREQFQPRRRYKGFLHHITKRRAVCTRLIKLKVPRLKRTPLTKEQVERLSAACHRLRDRLLIQLLYATGMRIGQALGLRHADVVSWDNEIRIVARDSNLNGARSKSLQSYTVHVTQELMRLYTEYLVNEFAETDSDYVFVNLWSGPIGTPMTYSNVVDLFRRLRQKTGIRVHPHLFRHTHATELIRSGWDAARVQKRLGHASIATTLNIYTHLEDNDLKQAYQDFAGKRQEEKL